MSFTVNLNTTPEQAVEARQAQIQESSNYLCAEFPVFLKTKVGNLFSSLETLSFGKRQVFHLGNPDQQKADNQKAEQITTHLQSNLPAPTFRFFASKGYVHIIVQGMSDELDQQHCEAVYQNYITYSLPSNLPPLRLQRDLSFNLLSVEGLSLPTLQRATSEEGAAGCSLLPICIRRAISESS